MAIEVLKTELESPQGLHKAEGGGSGFNSPELPPEPGVHLICKNVSQKRAGKSLNPVLGLLYTVPEW